MLRFGWRPYSLKFKHPFGLSYGTRLTTEVVFVSLQMEGFTGYGETSLPPYLGETQESVIDFFKRTKPFLESQGSEFNLGKMISSIDRIVPGNNAAKAALDIALHDLKGKILGCPVHELYGLASPEPKFTSVTISIGQLELIPEKIKELDNFQILKIKLGTGNDIQILETIRKHTNKKLVLDANQGWKDRGFALEMIQGVQDMPILFIEQPLAKENLKDTEWLKERSSIPIIADEAFKRLDDLEKISKAYHGINIKLMKCTGLHEAFNIIKEAREKDLKINLGCMTESSCAISAAAQLMGLADWIDLDGPLLITNNPFAGISYSSGKVIPDEKPGIGIDLLEPTFFD